MGSVYRLSANGNGALVGRSERKDPRRFDLLASRGSSVGSAPRTEPRIRECAGALPSGDRVIRVTVTDLETGESESQEIWDDYVVTCAGSCHVAHTNVMPTTGTHVLTIKGRKPDRNRTAAESETR